MHEMNNLYCMQIDEHYKNELLLKENENARIKELKNKKKRGY